MALQPPSPSYFPNGQSTCYQPSCGPSTNGFSTTWKRQLNAGTGRRRDGPSGSLLDAHSGGGHPRCNSVVVTSHHAARCTQADGVRAISLRGPVDDHFNGSVHGQRMAAMKTNACVAQVQDSTVEPLRLRAGLQGADSNRKIDLVTASKTPLLSRPHSGFTLRQPRYMGCYARGPQTARAVISNLNHQRIVARLI